MNPLPSPDMLSARSTIDQALLGAKAKGLQPLEAQLLMLHALGRQAVQRTWLIAHGNEHLSKEALACFEEHVIQRLDHVPLSYLTGQREFYGLTLHIDARVLDPRADTETLVDWAIELIDAQCKGFDTPQPQVLDMGTGSGAIALAIKANQPQASLWALDQSPAALEVAQKNALDLGLEVEFFQSHWFQALNTPSANKHPKRFDVIVSNPPYIAPHDPHLRDLVHEPLDALLAKDGGWADILQICTQAQHHLKAGGWLLLEHGYDQSHRVREILQNLGYIHIQSRYDLAGIERCTGAQWQKMK